MSGCCPSATRFFRLGELSRGACRQGLGASRRSFAILHRPLTRRRTARRSLFAGALAIRRQGIYFAMITLALAQMMFFFALQAKFTGGEDGIQAVPRGKLFGLIDLAEPDEHVCTRCSVIFLVGFLLIYRIIHSPFGEVLKAIRENEPRAISLGYKTDRYKLVAFVLSAALAGARRRRPRRSCCSSRRSPTCIGRCRAKSC